MGLFEYLSLHPLIGLSYLVIICLTLLGIAQAISSNKKEK